MFLADLRGRVASVEAAGSHEGAFRRELFWTLLAELWDEAGG